MEQNTNKGTSLPVVKIPTAKQVEGLPMVINVIPYHSDDVRAKVNAALNRPELFAAANADNIPDYTKEGEQPFLHVATFTQLFAIRRNEDNIQQGRQQVYRQHERKVVADMPKDGEFNPELMEQYGIDEKGKALYRPKVIKVIKGWKAVKLEPISYLVPTKKAIAVCFFAPETITARQLTVFAVNSLALMIENAKINGKTVPVRTSADINLTFEHEGKAVNTALLGSGIRCGLIVSDLNLFTNNMLKKITQVVNMKAKGKTELKPGLMQIK